MNQFTPGQSPAIDPYNQPSQYGTLPPYPPGQPKKTWSTGKIVAVVIACIVGGFVTLIAALLIFAFVMLGTSDATKLAFETAAKHPAVIEKLGTPIKRGTFVGGNINVQNDSGNAVLYIPVTGPKGSGTIHAVARKTKGQWSFTRLVFRPGMGAAIPLVAEPVEQRAYSGYAVQVQISKAAEELLQKQRRQITVSVDYFGQPKADANKAYVDSSGRIRLGRVQQDVNANVVAQFSTPIMDQDAIHQMDEDGAKLVIRASLAGTKPGEKPLKCSEVTSKIEEVQGQTVALRCDIK